MQETCESGASTAAALQRRQSANMRGRDEVFVEKQSLG